MIHPKDIEVIGACTQDGVYGLKDGSGMPWPQDGVPGDLRSFKEITSSAPPDRVNLLVCGMRTYRTMEGVKLGPRRVLLGVSRTEPKFMDENRGIISTFVEALLWEPSVVHKVFYIGGEAAWEYGMQVASTAHLTIINNTCDGDGVAKLKTPLHRMADEQGMTLTGMQPVKCPDKWARSFQFQMWSKDFT